MIQGQFPHLKDRMLLEEFGERRVVLHLMVLLYNYQSGVVGINHIYKELIHEPNGRVSLIQVSFGRRY
jgi:hypothetical protein